MNLGDILSKLTDYFVKKEDGNIGKILSILSDQLSQLNLTYDTIRNWRDIDLAEGTTLDKIGQLVNQPRGTATDAIYRLLIKSKVARNISNGDLNGIINVLAIALDADPSDIEIIELYNDLTSPESAAVSINRIPFDKLNSAGLSANQFGRIVQKTVSAGIRVSAIELIGTFAFSSVSNQAETDNNAGFGNISGTIGGYLGAAFQPSEEDDLPV